MSGTVILDIAGAQMGGAARYAAELRSYLARSERMDVRVIGLGRRVNSGLAAAARDFNAERSPPRSSQQCELCRPWRTEMDLATQRPALPER